MNVTLYTSSHCPYCFQAKEFLSRRGVPFVEKNVELDRNAAMEMVRISRQQGVPVITVDGQVVVGFDQPRLRRLLDQAVQARPKLGALIADAAAQIKKHPGIPAAGAYVGKVKPGSPVERVGLRGGDVITALGGEPVQRAGDVHRLLANMPPGREISLAYVRDGETHHTLIRL
ncbi:MAG: PDZ domain-containing protein [Anaerolineae bacterium]|nr:PDZ domain-containing protein [Anaerolineae bacterium]